MKYGWLGIGLLMLVMSGRAELPDYFRILADDYPLPGEACRPGTAPGGWQPAESDWTAGFGCGLTDVELSPRMDWVWPETAPRRTFRLIGQRGEIRAQSFVVRTLREVSRLEIEATDLIGPDGAKIAAENVDVRRVKYRIYQKDRGEVQEGNLLQKALPGDFPGGLSLWHWLSVWVPPNAAPGVYQGSLRLRGATGTVQTMPVVLRVLAKDFPGYPAGYWGVWLPGHFHGKSEGACRNYAPEWWTPERIETFFRFFRSRGFNCPVYSGVYSELWMSDGEIRADFSEINRFVAAQRRAGADAGLLLDSIAVEQWAHATNRWIVERYDGVKPAGFLGISMKDGRHCTQTGVAYNELDSAYFADAVRLLKRNAETNNWPHYFIYPEEEIDNRPEKTAGYEHFMPVLRRIVGDDHCLVVDNSVGYPWSNLDRGRRDRLPHRSYNLWVETALRQAREDRASVWTFNRGWGRTAWGLYLQRIGAVGANQWADAWDGGSYGEWYNAIPTGDGTVLTSLNYERAALGLRDLAVLRELAGLVGELREAGRAGDADFYQARLDGLSAFFPLEMFCWGLGEYQGSVKDAELEAKRYQALQDIDAAGRLLGRPDFLEATATAGKPALAAAEIPGSRRTGAGTADRWLFPDGRPTTEFSWTGKSETYQRSVAVSEQQFYELYQPPPVTVAAACRDDGLELSFRDPRRKITGTEAVLPVEQEDGYRIVLQPQGSEDTYRFVLDAAGRTAVRKNGALIPVELPAPLTAGADGVTQRVVLPWRLFGREAVPEQERWRFNAARFYAAGSLYATWTPTRDGVECNDGYLVFDLSGVPAESVEIGNVYPGRNRLSGVLPAPGLPVILTAPDGERWETRSGEGGDFLLEYRMTNTSAGNWQLRLDTRTIQFAAAARQTYLTALIPGEAVISGERTPIDVEFFIGNAERDFELGGAVVADDGRRLELSPMAVPDPAHRRLYLDTAGIPAGRWTVLLNLNGVEHRAAGCLNVLAPAW